ncbi:hypothetical protein E2C01_007080 [Portunus trituberculatus]|uniref:Uncharacterized protein n=1 Tax=Portunus trituberculatus TaxID=210409 RepID=A0A5B7D1F0_PORTR|nr:hypothetical protein [Portunus trituberculatus]
MKMRFSRGEVVFQKFKIRYKTANVAEVNEENVEGGVKTFWVSIERPVRPGDISSPPPERDSVAGSGVAICAPHHYANNDPTTLQHAAKDKFKTTSIYKEEKLEQPQCTRRQL